MAKGSEAKSAITQKILDTFEGSFAYDKEIRIPFVEGGEEVQIKVTLTCAKTNVARGAEDAVPSADNAPTVNGGNQEITETEKAEVQSTLAASFGF